MDDKVRIWHKQHIKLGPILLSTVQAAGNVVVCEGNVLGARTFLILLIVTEHCVNAIVFLNVVPDHLHLFMTAFYDGYF